MLSLVSWYVLLHVAVIHTHPAHNLVDYSEPRLWTAVFNNDYSELKVYDYQKRLLLDIRLQN